MIKTYHIGLLKQGKTIIVQCRKCIDYLSCELWEYIGERVTTKTRLKGIKGALLKSINLEFGTEFNNIIID